MNPSVWRHRGAIHPRLATAPHGCEPPVWQDVCCWWTLTRRKNCGARARNIPNVDVERAVTLNFYDIAVADHIVTSQPALDALQRRVGA